MNSIYTSRSDRLDMAMMPAKNETVGFYLFATLENTPNLQEVSGLINSLANKKKEDGYEE